MQIDFTGIAAWSLIVVPPFKRPAPELMCGQQAGRKACPHEGATRPISGRIRAALGVFAATLLALACLAAPAAAFERVGIVLLHGKTGAPSQFAAMAAMLEETGYGVERPEMCWSERRIYDRALDGCFEDVDAAVERLRADGFRRIVVGGHSLGGLVALAYGATHDDLAGIAALAPDGEPGDFNGHPKVAESVLRAVKLIQAGKGDEAASFTDRVLGRYFTVKATPRAFLSFLGPGSYLRPTRLLPRLAAPLFWAAGSRDSSQRDAAALYARAPDNPASIFVKLDASHLGTPGAALFPLMDWLDRLAED